MTNNDKLRQIISNIQLLGDLTNNMKDSEIYPVSFFSQAFDLIQKIQGDFHTLEADQVELFASQMKKHQALIVSIHQQMRHIEAVDDQKKNEPGSGKIATPPSNPVIQPAPDTRQEPAAAEPAIPKKASLLSRLGIYKEMADKEPVVTTKPDSDMPPAASSTPDKKEENIPDEIPSVTSITTPLDKQSAESPKTTPKVIETPIRPPVVKRPPRPMPKKDNPEEDTTSTPAPTTTKITGATPARKKESKAVSPAEATLSGATKKTTKSTITMPESPVEHAIRPPRPTLQTLSGGSQMPEAKTTGVSNGVPAEGSAPPSVNDAMEKRKLSDLRKAFSLNDRFRYRRELFGGNEEVMNKVIMALNNKVSYKESIRFLDEKLHWDFSNPTVKDFIKILEIRFL